MTYPLTSIVMATLGTWLIWEMLHNALHKLPDWLHTILAFMVGVLLLTAWPLVQYGLGIAAAVAMIRILMARLVRR